MKLIFISGMPASGKLTVAKELAVLTGYKLFHNHLTVDFLLSVFEFGSQPFIELRESIWLSVFEQACRARMAGLIFTFAPEKTVRQEFIGKTTSTVESHGGEVIFIELVCRVEELERRLDASSRQEHKKLTSLAAFRELNAADTFSSPKLPSPRLSVNTGIHSPKEAAALIAKGCAL
jgi:hypothetical protein